MGTAPADEYGHGVASSKRRPDKSKRYQQNKARREARAARSAHAGEATAISRGEREPASTTASRRTDTTTEKAVGRPRRTSPWKVPGQRAVVLAFLFTLVSAGTLLFAPIQVERRVPVDDPRVDEDAEIHDDGTATILEEGQLLEEESLPVAAMVLVVPVAITGVAVLYTKRPRRNLAWTGALLAFSAYIFLFSGPYGFISLPSLVALAVANFQARRVENKARLEQIRQAKAERIEAEKATGAGVTPQTDPDVIDVDAVEDVRTDDR